jgi:hypothetical protein
MKTGTNISRWFIIHDSLLHWTTCAAAAAETVSLNRLP